MSLNNEILSILEKKRGEFFSGQELAETLSVSRQAVWKNIKSLQSVGHKITAKPNLGYALESDSDLITMSGINVHSDLEIIIKNTVDSTNLEAKRLLALGKKNNFLVISEEQTSGLGRSGKSFFSPKNSIYMSLSLNLENKNTNVQLITCATAVAVCESIAKLTDTQPQIKWVNDILLEGKKICGILTEGILDFETVQIKNVIIGIGINCNQDLSRFPDNLHNVASSLTLNFPRNLLISEIVNSVLQNIFHFDKTVMSRYRKNSMTLGKNIVFQPETLNLQAKVIDIDDDGHLIAQKTDGTQLVISSGVVEIEGLYK